MNKNTSTLQTDALKNKSRCDKPTERIYSKNQKNTEEIFDNLKGGYVTVNDIAVILKISPKTVYDWVYRKIIPFKKINGALRFSMVEIERWLSKNGEPS